MNFDARGSVDNVHHRQKVAGPVKHRLGQCQHQDRDEDHSNHDRRGAHRASQIGDSEVTDEPIDWQHQEEGQRPRVVERQAHRDLPSGCMATEVGEPLDAEQRQGPARDPGPDLMLALATGRTAELGKLGWIDRR
jgi:hypothetical protein